MDALHPMADSDTMLTPFHIAIPVDDIAAARVFYGSVLGCAEGRSAETWIDFDLFGHQIVAHHKPRVAAQAEALHHNPVDGHEVPVPHFGVVLTMANWIALPHRATDPHRHAQREAERHHEINLRRHQRDLMGQPPQRP